MGRIRDWKRFSVWEGNAECGIMQIILPELQIDHIEYPELQKSVRSDVDAKRYVKDAKGTVYDRSADDRYEGAA